MFTLRVIGLYSLAYVCTFAWLWRFVVEAMTGRRSPRPLWPAWEFSARYVALLLQRVFCCGVGLVFAAVSVFVVFVVLIPRR